LLLPASASCTTDPYLAVTDTHHGQIVWDRYPTLEACEHAIAQVRNDTRCTTREEERTRRRAR
jgi:hypothetical protein